MKAPRISMPVTHGSHYGGAPLVPRSTQMRERWDTGSREPREPEHHSLSTLCGIEVRSGRKPRRPPDQDPDPDDLALRGDDGA